jgi:putative addiction module killer protein
VIRDRQAKQRINTQIRRWWRAGMPVGDIKTVDGDIKEVRFHFGPKYRVYFAQNVDSIVLLLIGGTKKSQSRDIERARKIFDESKKEK